VLNGTASTILSVEGAENRPYESPSAFYIWRLARAIGTCVRALVSDNREGIVWEGVSSSWRRAPISFYGVNHLTVVAE
jgi:hypothetical protein